MSKDTSISPKLIGSEEMTGTYLALSYYAGDIDPGTFTVGQDIDVQSLPKMFADAVTITRQLGYEYLWIKDICIQRDKKEDWARESANFASTYGRAALLISAIAAHDLKSGFLHDRHVHYSPGLGSNKDRYLRQHSLRWTWGDYTPLVKGPWAIQERVFAPQIVHYTNRQMIWQCSAGYQFEASGIDDKIVARGQDRQRYRKEAVQKFITQGLEYGSNTVIARDAQDLSDHTQRLEAWHQCIDELSTRELPHPTHKLPAVASLANILNNGTLGDYLGGIWSKNIACGLSWTRAYQILTAPSNYRAPSWSWASIDGPTSSLILSWPTTLLEDQASDPGWVDRYGPKLLSHHMIPIDARHPYLGVREGSHIILSGSCTPFAHLTRHIAATSAEARIFHITSVLDQSWIFDCQCCSGVERSVEEQALEVDRYTKDAEHHICVAMQCDGWKNRESACDMVVLRRMEGEEGEWYVRVGLVRLSLDFYHRPPYENEDGSFNGTVVHEEFEAIGWGRRELKMF